MPGNEEVRRLEGLLEDALRGKVAAEAEAQRLQRLRAEDIDRLEVVVEQVVLPARPTSE